MSEHSYPQPPQATRILIVLPVLLIAVAIAMLVGYLVDSGLAVRLLRSIRIRSIGK
jgi:hypothetical protein